MPCTFCCQLPVPAIRLTHTVLPTPAAYVQNGTVLVERKVVDASFRIETVGRQVCVTIWLNVLLVKIQMEYLLHTTFFFLNIGKVKIFVELRREYIA